MSMHPKSIIDNTAFHHVFLNLIFKRFTISWYTSSLGILILHADIILTDPWFPLFSQLLKTFPNSTQYMKSKLIFTDFSCLFFTHVTKKSFCYLFPYAAIVSFGKVASKEREEIEKFGLAVYSWDEFLKLVA